MVQHRHGRLIESCVSLNSATAICKLQYAWPWVNLNVISQDIDNSECFVCSSWLPLLCMWWQFHKLLLSTIMNLGEILMYSVKWIHLFFVMKKRTLEQLCIIHTCLWTMTAFMGCDLDQIFCANVFLFFMVTLCNRADHYIFALWFLSFFFFLA